VTSSCDYFGSVSYPDVIDCGMRVNKLGKSSVEYEVGIFKRGDEKVKAVGGFMHVFCDKDSGRPMADGMSAQIREALAKLLVDEPKRSKL